MLTNAGCPPAPHTSLTMRDKPRPRRAVSPTTLTLLTPLFRFSTARDAHVLRITGGKYGPVLVDRTKPPSAVTTPAATTASGRFTRVTDAERPEPPVTQSRQR